jgi:enolase
MSSINNILAREIIDSRGEPTVEVEITLKSGAKGAAAVESGASIGSYEMHELRDGDLGRLNGRGVTRVVENINHYLSAQIMGMEFESQREFDQYIIGLDGTPNLEHFGSNGILGVSYSYAIACANENREPLFRFAEHCFGQNNNKKLVIPSPMFTIFNGGKLASFSTDTQEFNVIIKKNLPFSESLRIGAEIYHAVGGILKDQKFGMQVGDEGGYAVPGATTDQAMALIVQGAALAGYTTDDIGIILDEAASNLFTDERLYHLIHHTGDVPSEYLIAKYEKLLTLFPLVGIEDGLADQDWDGWIELTKRVGDKMMVIGDDIFSTNDIRLNKGYTDHIANAIMIKPTQIGTLTGAYDAVAEAVKLGYTPILSHRSGDTESAFIAHIAVGFNCPYVKFGAPARGERVAKYNELLRIEEMLES